MKYQQPTFTLPTSTGKLTQTDWEIAVGLRNPDGTLVQPKKPKRELFRRIRKEASIG